ncbi:hypothetical protein FY034_00105 [Trichlorobacter lovleyi]|uniref:hypothetical protein n=1 Tax=Trichlorobacter lovleyi TaxID=313985 RepID=UPI00223F5FAE|nr:hypothetical protein [Trichlorobacter lovleyi]QOX77409.1 hypothetical protein FY034_00105 [Trichlorobacter lovleyi]
MNAGEHIKYTDSDEIFNVIPLASFWMELNNKERAKETLLLAEKNTKPDFFEMKLLSQAFRENLGDIESAKRFLRRAELLADYNLEYQDEKLERYEEILNEWKEIGDNEQLERFNIQFNIVAKDIRGN